MRVDILTLYEIINHWYVCTIHNDISPHLIYENVLPPNLQCPKLTMCALKSSLPVPVDVDWNFKLSCIIHQHFDSPILQFFSNSPKSKVLKKWGESRQERSKLTVTLVQEREGNRQQQATLLDKHNKIYHHHDDDRKCNDGQSHGRCNRQDLPQHADDFKGSNSEVSKARSK